LQDFGERAVDIVGSLRAGPNGEFAIGIFGGHGGVLLDGEMRAALVEKGVFEDFVGFCEALIDAAEFERDAFVDVAFVAVIVDSRKPTKSSRTLSSIKATRICRSSNTLL